MEREARRQVTYYPPVRRPWAIALLCCAVPARVGAQDAVQAPVHADAASASEPSPPEPSASPSVAVLLLPSGDVDAATADSLTELLISAVASRGDAHIVGKEEFQAQLGRGDQGTAECIESVPCLGRVGVALGVREIIAGTIGRRDGVWAFSVDRIDVRTAHIEGRVFREIAGGLDVVIRALGESVPELYVEVVQPGRLVVHADTEGAEVLLDDSLIGTVVGSSPVRRDLIEPGEHHVEVRAPGRADWHRDIDVESGTTFVVDATLIPIPPPPAESFEVPALTWLFGGIALGALGGAIGLGVSSQGTPTSTLSMRDSAGFFDAREAEAIAADVLFAVAGACAIVATIPLVLEASADRTPHYGAQASLSLALTPLGVSLHGVLE